MEEYGKNNKRKMVLKVDRKLARNVARWRMRQKGFKQINKDKGSGSFFANNWRNYIY